MIRKSSLSRSALPKRKTPVKRVNRARKTKNWSRAYGSVERVLFVKSLPCVYGDDATPCAGEIHNHHTRNDGKSRKGPYDCIVPICTTHHTQWHAGELAPLDWEVEAELTEVRWQIASNGRMQVEQQRRNLPTLFHKD